MEYLFVENFLILSLHKIVRENLGHKFCQKVRNLSIGRICIVERLVNLASSQAPLGCFLQECEFLVWPVIYKWTIFGQIVIVVKLFLVQNHRSHDLIDGFLDLFPHTRKAKHILTYLVGNLSWRQLLVEHMLLKEGIFAVHMRTIEQSIPIADVLPIVILIIMKAVRFVLDQVFVTFHVHPLFFLLFSFLHLLN